MLVAFLMEGVLAIAVGLGLWLNGKAWPFEPLSFWSLNFAYLCVRAFNRFAAGVGLVLGIGTWLELAKGRASDAWGPGRWVLSVVAAWFLVLLAAHLAPYYFWFQFHEETVALRSSLSARFLNVFDHRFGGMVAAVLLTHALGGPANSRPADGREWAGRFLAALVVAQALTVSAFDVFYLNRDLIGLS